MLGWFIFIAVILVVVVFIVQGRRQPVSYIGISDEAETDAVPVEPVPASGRLSRNRLTEQDRNGFLQAWHSVQDHFDADPKAAVIYADLLVSDLIRETGRPGAPDESESDFVPSKLKEKYLAAHAIAVQNKLGVLRPGELRRAMSLYAVVFDEILGNGKGPETGRIRMERVHDHRF
jgi:hypothetical protein